jgi:hypothetical protein
MKPACFVFSFLCLAAPIFGQSNPVSQPKLKAEARVLDSYGKLPLSFEVNQGQADARVKFFSRTGGYSLFLTEDEAVLAFSGKKADHGRAVPEAGAVLRMTLRNTSPAARVTGLDELPGTTNYFIGNDPAKWHTNVPTYTKVKYESIYSGVDLVYYGNQRQLEYDFIVAPGADPHCIAFDLSGAKRIRQDKHGELVLKMADDEIRWHQPVVYQEKDGARQEIAARYTITDTNRVGFEVAKYDADRALYIDPLIYSTYLGGSGGDFGYGIAVDSSGNAYVTGYTDSTDFPTSPGALQTMYGGGSDAFVTKLNPTGTALVYSTYLGGSANDSGYGIAVDSAGDVYLSGTTSSTNFPVTSSAFQTACGGTCLGNAFVTEINPTGSALLYSTYLGGSGQDSGDTIVADSSGSAYITGRTNSSNFPTTPGAFQAVLNGSDNIFVTKLNPTGSALDYSTYLGGSGGTTPGSALFLNYGPGIAVDSSGNAYVTGSTESTDFPVTPGTQTVCGLDSTHLCQSAFVTKLNPTGTALVYSTYMGGSNSYGNGIAVDSSGNAYVTGTTDSDGSTALPCQGPYDAFVTKLNSTGTATLYYTSVCSYGFPNYNYGSGIAVDSSDNAWVTGYTQSKRFPVTPAPNCLKECVGAFVTKLNQTGTALIYSTLLGGSTYGSGIAVDSSGNAYVTGYTYSANFPVTPGAFQANLKGNPNAFVTKLQWVAGTTTTLSSSANPSTYGQAVTFTASVASALGPLDGGTVSFMKGKTVLNTGTLSGGSASFTTSAFNVGTDSITAVYDSGNPNLADSTSKPVKQVVVGKAATSATLISSLNPSVYGQAITLTATVTSSISNTPTGTVTFAGIGSAKLNGGVATLAKTWLTAGTYAIKAEYAGDSDFDPSTSSVLNEVVNPAPTTTTIVSSADPSLSGQTVTFKATVTSSTGAHATGTVTFTAGSTTLGTVTLNGIVASISTSTLPVGSTTVTATYNGATDYTGSSGSVLQSVQP